MVYMITTNSIKNIEHKYINNSNSINSYAYLINIKNQFNTPYYRDISLFNILKTLKYLKKISKNQYNTSIKRLKTDRKLNYKIYEIIHYFLLTNKAHTTKTTISYLKRTEHKTFIILNYKNQKYKVFIKKKAYKNLFNIDINLLEKEFSLFMINKYNKFYGGVMSYKLIN